MRTTFYHVISNGYDKPPKPSTVCEHCCYTVIAGACSKEFGPIFNRYHKIVGAPKLSDLTIYMDGNIGMKLSSCEMHGWAEMVLAEADMAICRHAARKCSYVEIEACLARGKISKTQAEIAHGVMSEANHPKNYGLWECGIILRRANVDWVKELERNWFGLIASCGVVRDQLWLPMAMRKTKIPAGRFKTIEMDVRQNNLFTFGKHA